MSNFDTIVLNTLKSEGSEFTNDPNDRGGPTRWGITQHDLAQFRGHSVSADDVKNMTVDEAKTIYKTKYWDPCNLDAITSYKKALIIFDQGVLCGTGTAAKRAQSACNAHLVPGLIVDGVIGPKSLKAINEMDEKLFCLEFLFLTQHYFLGIILNNPTQTVFMRGWLNRSQNLMKDVLL